jgi:hypothetical protein
MQQVLSGAMAGSDPNLHLVGQFLCMHFHDAGKWDKGRFDTIVNGITPFLRQCGYNMKKEVVFLPVSGCGCAAVCISGAQAANICV